MSVGSVFLSGRRLDSSSSSRGLEGTRGYKKRFQYPRVAFFPPCPGWTVRPRVTTQNRQVRALQNSPANVTGTGQNPLSLQTGFRGRITAAIRFPQSVVGVAGGLAGEVEQSRPSATTRRRQRSLGQLHRPHNEEHPRERLTLRVRGRFINALNERRNRREHSTTRPVRGRSR